MESAEYRNAVYATLCAPYQSGLIVDALTKIASCSRYPEDDGTNSAFALDSVREIAVTALLEYTRSLHPQSNAPVPAPKAKP